MLLNDNIKRRRAELELTLEEVAKIVGVSRQTIQRYENGVIANIPSNRIELLAKALRTSISYLMTGKDSVEINLSSIKNISPMPKKKVPIIGTIAAGKPILADENIEGFVPLTDGIHADFALNIKGDSMIGDNINDGDVVFIKQQPVVDNGQIAAVLIDEEATLKRFYKIGNMIQLTPSNPKYEPMLYTEDNCDDIRILGLAVATLSEIKY